MASRIGNQRKLECGCNRMEKLILYETSSYFYLVGTSNSEEKYQMLKIDRGVEKPESLSDILTDDQSEYTKQEMTEVLAMIDEGNKASGGLSQVVVACGIFGFIRFLDCYYITLVTQRKKVGKIGPNFIYSIKAAEVFSIKPKDKSSKNPFLKLWSKVSKKMNQTTTDTAESKYMGLYHFLDITKDFYFSYSYDLTNSLQRNYTMDLTSTFPPPPTNDMFDWTYYQMEEFKTILGDLRASVWAVPIVHGSFQQKMFSIFGRTLYISLIARRSRHYAGTRYLKRGVSVHGKVANDCEVEEIFQFEDGVLAKFASYIQHRGSIPTYWAQETSVTIPKPPILINRYDPTFLATQEHFADLFLRYGSPVLVLDLVKQTERKARESLIGGCFKEAIQVLNEYIDSEHKIRYCAVDFSRVSKSSLTSSASTSSVNTVPNNPVCETLSGEDYLKSKQKFSLESKAYEPTLLEDIPTSRFSDALHSQQPLTPPRGTVASSESPVTSGFSSLESFQSLKVNSGSVDDIPRLLDKSKADVPVMGKVDIFQELQDVANWSISQTGFFCSDLSHVTREKNVSSHQKDAAQSVGYMEQHGILRTNCVDCLDRTNTGQFAVGVQFLSVAIHVLGLSDSLISEPSNPFVMTLMGMFTDMGDKLALQYGGSEAHSKMGQSGSSLKGSGELLTSIKRYYSNAFTDRVKQDSINLFLGHFIPSYSKFALWELDSDYNLHNKLLRPKTPYSDEILLSQAGSRYAEECFEKIQESKTEESSESIRKSYLISQSVNDETLMSIISRKMKRRDAYELKHKRIREAQQEWWRLAIHEHSARKMWMHLSKISPENRRLTSFLRLYKPSILTSFDQIISGDEFSNPIIVDSSTLLTLKAAQWVEKKVIDSPFGTADDSESGVGMLGKIGQFAGQIGLRARNLVGGFLRKEESAEGASQGNSDDGKSKSVNISQRASIRLCSSIEEDFYKSYISSADRVMSEYPCTSRSLHEFEEALKELTIGLDDAKAMKQLSHDSYVGYTCKGGLYEGLDYTVDAVVQHGSLNTCMVAVENLLSMNLLSKQDISLVLPEVYVQRLEHIGVQNKLKTGMILEYQVRASQFLIEQQMYAREIDHNRIINSTSSFSSQNSFLRYASSFDEDVLALEYHTLSTHVHNLTHFRRNLHYEDLNSFLAPLKKAHEKYKTLNVNLKLANELEGDGVTNISAAAVSSLNNRYEDFTEISDDLYAKKSNPFFHMNKVSVESFFVGKKWQI